MIRVCCDYDYNCNTAIFDNLSLIKDTVKSYTYDDDGNTVSAVDNAQNKSTFEYQDNDLVKQNNPTGYSYNYTYDSKHNLLTAKSENEVTYSFTYDSYGNPLSYRNGTLAWTGRQLKSHTSTSGTTTIYTYNSDGVRIGKKSVYQGNTSETSYVVSGTQILSETKGSTTTYYIYDEKGLPIGIVYNGTTYTYRKNLQGDIIAILNSAGTEVVTYTYNAWGAVEDISGSLETTLGAKNPFRYRGYYYDTETGYYYLNSRYYDPVTGRFLNPEPNVDSGAFDSGAGLLGYNVYAYCRNNPVMYKDENGEFLLTAIIVGAVVGAVVGGAIGGAIAYNSSKETGLAGADLFWSTAAGVGKGALLGGVVGGLVGASVGVIGAGFGTSIGGTAVITGTGTTIAKGTEVTFLQKNKSEQDGKSGWEVADNCLTSTFNNAFKVTSSVATKSTITTGAYLIKSYREFPVRGLPFSLYLASTAETPVIPYFLMSWAGLNAACSAFDENPSKRAYERGYVLI